MASTTDNLHYGGLHLESSDVLIPRDDLKIVLRHTFINHPQVFLIKSREDEHSSVSKLVHSIFTNTGVLVSKLNLKCCQAVGGCTAIIS